MRIVVDGDGTNAQFEQGSWNDSDLGVFVGDSNPGPDAEFAVGDSPTIGSSNGSETSLTPGNEHRIRLIHVPSDSILLDQDVTLR